MVYHIPFEKPFAFFRYTRSLFFCDFFFYVFVYRAPSEGQNSTGLKEISTDVRKAITLIMKKLKKFLNVGETFIKKKYRPEDDIKPCHRT